MAGTKSTAGKVPIPEPLLDVDEIQGNILAGFNKDHQRLIGLRIRGVTEARRWLARILPDVSSLAEVYHFNALFRMRRARLGRDPSGLVATWMNIAFSREGLAKLSSDSEAGALPDAAFQTGLNKDRADFLGDPKPPGENDPTASWVIGGTKHPVDILMIVASDDKIRLDSVVVQLRPAAIEGPAAPEIVWEEQGETRPDLPGHEHFGFKDGVSQPGVRGLISRRPKIYLTPRQLKAPVAGEIEFGKPGQPLTWPGQFVLGYPFQDRDGAAQLAPPLGRAWFKNGSFLVFRRLEQDVAGFSAFLEAEADRLSKTAGFHGIAAKQLGALLVGRWPSGAPISRTPGADNPDLAADSLSNNDFLFTQDTPAPVFRPGSGASPGAFPRAMEGSKGPICPHAAHIFKVNPRDNATNLGPDFDTLTRRILRRGIPFGPPLADPLKGDNGASRGLHFLCYQASIVDQFEILQQNWANNTGAPTSGGHDMIIGQTKTAARTIDLPPVVPNQAGETIAAPIAWVKPTGGGYFFAPSIRAIRDVLAVGAGLSA
jgi:Dyp-type peroxidase family